MKWANSLYEQKDELGALRHEIGRLSQEYDILNDHYRELQLRGQDKDARIRELEAALEAIEAGETVSGEYSLADIIQTHYKIAHAALAHAKEETIHG